MGCDGGIVGVDGLSYKLCHPNLVDVCGVSECLLDVLHVGTSTSEHYTSEQLVDIFVRYLIPCVLDDFQHTRLNNFNELPAVNAPVVVNGIFLGIVNVVVVCICATILYFHILCILVLHLQRRDILGDIVASKWNDSQMTQNVL